MDFKKLLDQEAYRFLLTGGLALSEKIPDPPKADWILAKNWGEITRLSDVHTLKGIHAEFYKNDYLEGFKKIYDSLSP